MRYVIFSDVHGNYEALERMIEVESQNDIDGFIFSGDIVGYYYEFRKIINIMKIIPNLIVTRGNHDQMYIDAFEDKDKTEQLIKKYGSAYADKDLETFEYLKKMPLYTVIKCDDVRIRIQHGTPTNLLEGRIYPTDENFMPTEDNIVVTGHTHYRLLKRTENNLWINPGSLGQPRDGEGFSYCILDTKSLCVEFCSVNIDVDKLAELARNNDFENKYLVDILYRERGNK